MTIKQRIQSPTPRFFKTIRNIGLALAAASAVVLASPVALPAAIIQAAVYAGLAGSVASAISQAVTTTESPEPDEDGYES